MNRLLIDSPPNIEGIINGLVHRGIRLHAEGDRLVLIAPKAAVTAADRDELRRHKSALLAHLSARQTDAEPIHPGPRDGDLPLSFAQERMWILDHFGGGGAAYAMAGIWRLRGELDCTALRRALDTIIARHEILRTSYRDGTSGPVQVVGAASGFRLIAVACPGLPVEQRLAEYRRQGAMELAQPFDLASGAVIRGRLVTCADDDHALYLTAHHIVADAWSVDLLMIELTTLYTAFVRGGSDPLAPLAIQYADYACWQRERLAGERLDGLTAHWLHTLEGAPALDLPTDRPRGQAQDFAGGSVAVELPAALVARLNALARQHQTTLFMTVLAGWAAVLARLGGQDEVVVGTVVADRDRPETAPLIGFFVNTLALRIACDPAAAVSVHLARTRRVVLDALAHQEAPFEHVLKALQVGPARPLVQALFDLNHRQPGRGDLPGVRIEPLANDETQALFELRLALVGDDDGALRGRIEYARALFDEISIRRWAVHLRVLLEAMVSAPSTPLPRLPWLDAAQRQQLVESFNATANDWQHDTCVHHWFEAQVGRTPDVIAVRWNDVALTYRQLDQAANRLAHHLRALGVGPDGLVAVAIERSTDLEIALLAVLKAGGAYVPLDPDYPAERLAFMLEDSAPTVLLSQSPLIARLPATAVPTLCLDRDAARWADQPATAPVSGVGPRHLAYMIYTSGSTGRPKGAMNEHRAIVNRLRWMQQAYPLNPADRVLQKTPASFDVSVWEFFWPLMYGATLVFAKPEGHKDPTYLADLIERERITTLHFVPSMLAAFLEASDLARRCASLKRIICSGEALPYALTQRCFALIPQAELHNLYGPTECAVDVTAWACRRNDPRGLVPIGAPIANTRMYVLDAERQPQPIGVPGDLFIAGIQVGRGYHNRDELTRERFLCDPFVPGGRMYLTGDRARWLADGNLEYLGRSDFQVKLRGQRIELGEIEAAVLAEPGIRSAAVLLREDRPGDQRLVAYVVAELDSETAAPTVEGWGQVFDAVYAAQTAADPTFDIAGWKDTAFGRPIPSDEMREWVDTTVERLRTLPHQNVLEIGCGTGLLLYRLASDCARYVGVDLSEHAIRTLTAQLGREPEHWRQVRLHRAAAHELATVPDCAAGGFDLVVLNSVVQLFPSADYLIEVLTLAASLLAPGGRIVVGDVRHRDLALALHRDVARQRAEPGTPADSLERAARQALAEDEELLLSPAFFNALRQRIPALARVVPLVKRGRYDNELSRYRYDVVLQIGPVETTTAPAVTATWQVGDSLERLRLRLRLSSENPNGLCVRGIPDARIPDAGLTASSAACLAGAVHPEDLYELAQSLGYTAEVRPATEPAQLDLLLSRSGLVAIPEVIPSEAPQSFASVPVARGAAARASRALATRLRTALASRLPAHLVPAAFVRLDALPLSPSGKLDRKRLPPPVDDRGDVVGFQAPQTGLETTLAGLWGELLGVERVGRGDDFFRLGGHSLLAVRLAARLQPALGRTVPVGLVLQHPQLADLATALSALGAAAEEALPRADRSRPLPVGFAAERMWQLDFLGQGAAYQLGGALRIDGAVDTDALRHALDILCERHEGLRCTFHATADGVERHLHAALPPRWESATVADLAAATQTAQRFLALPIDLTAGPLLAGGVWSAGKCSVLVLQSHHAVADGWSVGVLLAELGEIYRALRSGTTPSLPALPAQDADLAVWDRHRDLTQVLEVWRQRLHGFAPPELPCPLGSGQPGSLRDLRQVWPAELTRSLRRRARDLGCTPAVLVQAVFAVLLSRLADAPRAVWGLVHAGRDHADSHNVVAMRVGVLPFQIDVPRTRTWTALVADLARAQAGLHNLAWAAWPALDALDAEHRRRATDVLFAWNADLPLDLPDFGAPTAAIDDLTGRAQSLLALTVTGDGEALTGYWEGDSDRIETPVFAAWTAAFLHLLTGLLADPAQRPAFTGLAAPATPGPAWTAPVATAPERIWLQATATPTALAIIDGDQHWTYERLVQRAESWAAHVVARRGQPIVLCARRSAERIAALLGIWRSGAVAVLLDPAHGKLRTAAVIARVQATTVLDDAALAAGPQAAHALPPTPSLDDAAYIIFTSGSTGEPKGVIIDHRALACHVASWSCAINLSAEDRILHVSGVGFDAHLEEIVPSLVHGAAIVVAGMDLPEPRYLAGLCRAHGVTILDPVVSIARIWSEDAAALPIPPTVRLLAVGSEPLDGRLLPRLARPRLVILNTYGPTETTITPTIHRCTPADAQAGIVPIGRPLPHQRASVVDAADQRLPPGFSGELLLGGPALAWGYWRDPRKTALAFIPDLGGGRRYRTGDRVRQDADGTLQFLGRRDRQVKINGVRIELAEIEAALASHPSVVEAVADLRHDRLVAWVRLRSEASTASSAATEVAITGLRAWATSRLPRAAVPGPITVVDRWPLNANGKLDRRALPVPQSETIHSRPPRPGAEQQVACIVARILGCDLAGLGAEDDLFDRGLTSLSLLRLAARLGQAFATACPIARLMTTPTIAGIAASLTGSSAPWQPLVQLTRGHPGGATILACPGAGGSGAIAFSTLARIVPASTALWVVEPRGLDGRQPPFASVEEQADAVLDELSRVLPIGPLVLIGHSFGAWIAHALGLALGERVQELIVLDANAPGQSPPMVLDAKETLNDVLDIVATFTGLAVPTGDGTTALARLMVEAGLAQGPNDPAIAGLLAVYAAQVACDHRPTQTRLGCPIHLVRSAETQPPVEGWLSYAGLTTTTIDAGHIELLRHAQEWSTDLVAVTS